MKRKCSVAECECDSYMRGMCRKHDNRMQKHGTTDRPVRVRSDQWKFCAFASCNKHSRSRSGFCTIHAYHFNKYGDPNPEAHIGYGRKPIGTTQSAGNGYIFVKVAQPDVWMLQHRAVMEEMLGRALRPYENVHHKNGQTDDNRTSNLELWITKQPAGKRPQDLIQFAHEILEEYEKNTPTGGSDTE